MKKILAAVMTAALIFMLAGCGSSSSSTSSSKSSKIDINQTLEFENFSVDVNDAEVKDGELIVNISWLNKTYPKAKKFMAAIAGVDASQDGNAISETDEQYSDPDSDVQFENAVGGEWEIELKYKLDNETSPVTLTFVPADFNQESQTVTINLQ